MGMGLFKKAHSMAETLNRTLLIADSGNNEHVIKEIDRDGNLVKIFGTRGVPSNTGYDINYYETMVKEGRTPTECPWNKDPASNAKVDSIRRRGEPFCKPCSMIMDTDGRYFAADGYGNCAVHVFDSDGSLSYSWGKPGIEPGGFRIVHDVCIDKYNRVWIADRENCRAQAFSKSGELLAVVDGNLFRVAGIWTDNNYLYIGEMDGGITLINIDTLEVAGQVGYYKSVLRAHGITGDGSGNLFLSTNSWNSNNIVKLTKRQ